jgi:hypothetical protein
MPLVDALSSSFAPVFALFLFGSIWSLHREGAGIPYKANLGSEQIEQALENGVSMITRIYEASGRAAKDVRPTFSPVFGASQK